jgi:hypothetical protein
VVKKKWTLRCKGRAFVLFLVLGLTTQACGITFFPTPIPEGPCSIDTLLIEESILPEGVFTETGSRSIKDAPARVGIERTGTSFSSPDRGELISMFIDF